MEPRGATGVPQQPQHDDRHATAPVSVDRLRAWARLATERGARSDLVPAQRARD